MPIITLTDGARVDKWGLVVISNPDGSFNREFKISGEELAALQASGDSVPPGVTAAEWHDTKTPDGQSCAHVYGKEMSIGDVKVSRSKQGINGVTIKYDESVDPFTGRFSEQFLFVPDDQYTGTLPAISVDADKLPEGIISLVDGVLTLGSR